MEWTNITMIISLVFGSGGLLTGIAGWLKARPEKISFEIKNLREVIEEIKKNNVEYKAETKEEIDDLQKKISALELKDDIKSKAISKWLTCNHVPRDSTCPVADFMDSAEKIIKKNLDNLKKQKNEQ